VAEFSLLIPGQESLATAIPGLVIALWLAVNVALILWEVLRWLVIVLTDVIRRPFEVSIYFHDKARTYGSGLPRDFRKKLRTRYGRYPLSTFERIFALYGWFRVKSFGGEVPYEDIELDLLDVTRSCVSEAFTVRFVFRERGEVNDETKVLRSGQSEPIPRNNDGTKPYTDYKIYLKWVW
jgi:hypothetical protein